QDKSEEKPSYCFFCFCLSFGECFSRLVRLLHFFIITPAEALVRFYFIWIRILCLTDVFMILFMIGVIVFMFISSPKSAHWEALPFSLTCIYWLIISKVAANVLIGLFMYELVGRNVFCSVVNPCCSVLIRRGSVEVNFVRFKS